MPFFETICKCTKCVFSVLPVMRALYVFRVFKKFYIIGFTENKTLGNFSVLLINKSQYLCNDVKYFNEIRCISSQKSGGGKLDYKYLI